MIEAIKDTLHELGITRTYKGYIRTAVAVMLAIENENRLYSITNDLYSITGEQCGCSATAVERSIRTVIQRAWQTNPNMLADIAGYPLTCPPTVSEFVEMLMNYTIRHLMQEKSS